MNFSDYLFFTQRLTVEDYITLMTMQNREAYAAWLAGDCSKTFPTHLSATGNLSEVRRVPFGDVLQGNMTWLKNVALGGNPAETIEKLIVEWRKWHVNNLEPICMYALDTKIGHELYNHQVEKKLVARYVAEKYVMDADVVCIPEGSSATYVGLAIATRHQAVTIVTSNTPLLREYRDNKELHDPFKEMKSIGGHVDDFIAHGGVSGPNCEEQFEAAIKKHPGATTVVMAVTCLLPKEGPYGRDAATRDLKHMLINKSLEANVRQLIFVTDYSKHLPSRRMTNDSPVFSRPDDWGDIVRKHRDRISIVTVPPPELRKLMKSRTVGQPLIRQFANTNPYSLPDAEEEYDVIAKELARLTRKGTSYDCKFIEVVD